MPKTIAIARREIAERSFVFITAVVLTLAPTLALIVPRGTFEDRLSAFGILSFILAVGFTGGLAITLGASLVGRELSEKRMSFYFSRPVTGAQIWFGKLGAAIAILLACMLIVFTPSVFFASSVAPWIGGAPLAADIVAGALLLLFTGHTLSIMFRSRTAWIALDFVAAIVFTIALVAALIPLLLHHGLHVSILILAIVAVAFLAIVALAGALQLARGRIDLHSNHRELSKALWTSLGIVLVLVIALVAWATSFGPHDLGYVGVQWAPAGTWLKAEGLAKNRGDLRGAYFYDTASGASISIPPQYAWYAQFDRTGTSAAWLEPVNPIGTLVDELLSQHRPQAVEIVIARLTLGAKAVHTGIFVNDVQPFLETTPDLSRVVLTGGGMLTVYDVKSRAALATVRTPERYTFTQFASPSVLRFFSYNNNKSITVRKLDVASRAVTTILETSGSYMRVGGDGRTLVVYSHDIGATPAYRFFDLATGHELAGPAVGEGDSVRVMRDGRYLVVSHDGHLSVYNGAALQHDVSTDLRVIRSIREAAPDQFIIAWAQPHFTNVLFDASRGVVAGKHEMSEKFGSRSPVTWDGKPVL